MSDQQGGKPGDALPPDPITAAMDAANQMHELYCAYVTAGFTEAQALQIVLALATASLGKGS